MQIALVNASQRVKDPQAMREISAALSRQMLSVAAAYHRLAIPVVYHADASSVPAAAWPLVVVDSPDVAGALGYHTEDPSAGGPGGLPKVHGFVFVNPVLDNGGTVLDGENSIAAVASHEAVEIFGDAPCNILADDGAGKAYAFELCDPCEADSYLVQGMARTVSVSNFVLPSWFDPQAVGEPVDWLKKLPKPFSMDRGGYVSYLAEGKAQQVFGDEAVQWRRDVHGLPGSRAFRRMDNLRRMAGEHS